MYWICTAKVHRKFTENTSSDKRPVEMVFSFDSECVSKVLMHVKVLQNVYFIGYIL